MSHYKAIFDTLTKGQERTLGLIAINQDGWHNPMTLRSLMRRGLIERREEWDVSGSLAVRIIRYHVPLPVHIEWCEWISENLTPEERAEAER